MVGVCVWGESHRETRSAEKGIKSQTQVKGKNNGMQNNVSLICELFFPLRFLTICNYGSIVICEHDPVVTPCPMTE